MFIIHFLAWTLMLYIVHRISHTVSILKKLHLDHHKCVSTNKHLAKWHWSNLMLFTDTWTSSVDLWITEIIPTIVFSYITGAWWISIFYYLWAAFLQESLEHKRALNVYPLTAGQWHLVHHRRPNKNFGLFIPIWDKLFKTEYDTSLQK